jgi:tRNA-specific 2-thiouridylase
MQAALARARAAEQMANHLQTPIGRGHTPHDCTTGAAGGAACGDLIRVSLAVDPGSAVGLIADAGFDASGCGALLACGSAVVGLVRGKPLLDAARIGVREIAGEVGGLSHAKLHAAELAADALHRALGAGARAHARLAPAKSRTLVAMSGGVDSAVAALLIACEGTPTVGVTLELWSDPESDGELSCCSAQAVRGARSLAHELDMPHLSIDLRREFRDGVVNPWLDNLRAGRTPNPCVRCNGSVRLDAMLELGRRLGASTLATGHYARIENGPLLRVASDEARDQSYVLAALDPASLAHVRFPLGHMRKADVREVARGAGVAVADRPASQDLCFLAGTRQDSFLARHGGIANRPGPVLDGHGRRLGEHRGAHLYTIGQRRGLGIGGGRPLYVLSTNVHSNTVTVGPRERLLSHSMAVLDVTLHRHARFVDGVRVRAHGRTLRCRVSDNLGAGRHERARVQLEQPAERTAPGQLACLYAADVLIGHGTIAR